VSRDRYSQLLNSENLSLRIQLQEITEELKAARAELARPQKKGLFGR
jgi:hypothetical protein